MEFLRSKLKCERCGEQISDHDQLGDPIDKNVPWEQFLCCDCYENIWDETLNYACGVCRTRPCERGRDCWAEPHWSQVRYLCYVAPRITNKITKVAIISYDVDLFQEILDNFGLTIKW